MFREGKKASEKIKLVFSAAEWSVGPSLAVFAFLLGFSSFLAEAFFLSFLTGS